MHVPVFMIYKDKKKLTAFTDNKRAVISIFCYLVIFNKMERSLEIWKCTDFVYIWSCILCLLNYLFLELCFESIKTYDVCIKALFEYAD